MSRPIEELISDLDPKLATEIFKRFEALRKELDDTRALAQHLLECARGNDVVQQDLPDWLEDEGEEEEEE